MTTRLPGLPAVIAALLVSGCADAVEPPQAEPPKPKTTAELLVGTWEWVKTADNTISGVVRSQVTFTPDGRFFSWSTDPPAGPVVRERNGTYRLEGRTLRITREETPDEPGETGELGIESVTETELILARSPEDNGKRHRSKYKRIEQK